MPPEQKGFFKLTPLVKPGQTLHFPGNNPLFGCEISFSTWEKQRGQRREGEEFRDKCSA